MRFAWNINLNISCADLSLVSPSGNGPCLGFRKPGQPYEWISYTEVWHDDDFCDFFFFFTVHAAFDPSALLRLPFYWLSSSDPAGGGEGTSAGLWAAGQRLPAEPAAVCRDICTEQTRGMKRDKDFKAFLIRFNLRLFFLLNFADYVMAYFNFVRPECVLNLFIQGDSFRWLWLSSTAYNTLITNSFF